MRYLLNNSTDPYFNMALDEFCLENIVLDEPYFYLWRNRPSVIIGLNQNAYSEVNLKYLEENGINLVRRVTGGGAVYHDLQNLNYTIVSPICHPERSEGSMERSEGSTPAPIVAALRQLGVPAELTGRNDIFVEGRKVSGYARRVSKRQEIIHGTLMYDVDIDTLTHVLDTPGSKLNAKGIGSVKSRVANLKDYLPGFKSLDEVQAALQDILASGDPQMELTESQLNEVRIMAETKFSTWDFIYGRSRETGIARTASLPCGTVSVEVCLDHGLITSISFYGDFLFGEPVQELSSILTGLRYDRPSIYESLMKADVSRFFPGSSVDEVLNLIVSL
ncbi:MAG: lipoate--protein ligase [Bacteroidales bacterium]|nr:lipoate--protein ligase [Bacteroidales bacterium]